MRRADGRSTRVFNRRIDGRPLTLMVAVNASPLRLLDADTRSAWSFAGTALSGAQRGRQRLRVPFLEEYWFDWHAYHPGSEIARR